MYDCQTLQTGARARLGFQARTPGSVGGASQPATVFGDTWGWGESYWTQMDDIGPAPYQISELILNGALEVTVSAQAAGTPPASATLTITR